MHEQTDLPRIKPDEKPSYLNAEAADWGFLGALVGGIAGGIVGTGKIGATGKPPIISTALYVGGAVLGIGYGANKGKARMELEQREGRAVKTPSFWNRGIFTGWFTTSLGLAAVNVALSSVSGVHISPVLGLGAVVGGMAIGSNMRKHSLARDHERSIALRDAQLKESAYKNISQGLYTNTVTPEEYRNIEAKRQNKPAKESEPNLTIGV